MTQEIKQAQVPAPAEKPAPSGKTEQPKVREAAVIELTDADLQAVIGGGGLAGGVLPSNSR